MQCKAKQILHRDKDTTGQGDQGGLSGARTPKALGERLDSQRQREDSVRETVSIARVPWEIQERVRHELATPWIWYCEKIMWAHESDNQPAQAEGESKHYGALDKVVGNLRVWKRDSCVHQFNKYSSGRITTLLIFTLSALELYYYL